MNVEGPKGFTGLEIVTVELDRQYRINSELLQKNVELEQKIQELEKIIRSYQSNSVPEVIM
jgi:cell division septum initiation protein DivIVA